MHFYQYIISYLESAYTYLWFFLRNQQENDKLIRKCVQKLMRDHNEIRFTY